MNNKYDTCKKYEIKCPYSNLNRKCIGIDGECNHHSILYYKKEKNLGTGKIGNSEFSEKISKLEKISWVADFLKS